MNFKTIQEAFNYWNTKSVAEIEVRAEQIREILKTDAAVDVAALNIEIEGLKQAKANREERSAAGAASPCGFIPVTGASFETRASETAISGDVLSSPEYRSAFLKSLLNQQLTQPEQAAFNRMQTETRSNEFISTTDAAAVLPTALLDEVISKARTMGGILPHCRSFAMPSKIAIPVMTPGSAAAWHVEGAAVDTDEAVPVSVTFAGYEIVKIFSISVAARTMSITAFESYLVQELAACIMSTISNALVNGTGNGQGTGILTATGTTPTTYTKTGITYADIVRIMPLLKRGYAAGAMFAMSNATLYGQIYALTDQNKRPVFIQDAQADSVGRILGFPVVVDDYIPADTIIFGNFNYMAYNLPAGIQMEKSTQSSFKSALIDYRGLAVADCKPIIDEAFVIATKAAA